MLSGFVGIGDDSLIVMFKPELLAIVGETLRSRTTPLPCTRLGHRFKKNGLSPQAASFSIHR